jgi:Mn-dependent DtxR family transcriptional regulator
MTNSSYFRKTLHMLSCIEKKSKDETMELDLDSKENAQMVSALEQLGLVEKKRRGYIISAKGKNILNYFKNNSGKWGDSPLISNE